MHVLESHLPLVLEKYRFLGIADEQGFEADHATICQTKSNIKVKNSEKKLNFLKKKVHVMKTGEVGKVKYKIFKDKINKKRMLERDGAIANDAKYLVEDNTYEQNTLLSICSRFALPKKRSALIFSRFLKCAKNKASCPEERFCFHLLTQHEISKLYDTVKTMFI